MNPYDSLSQGTFVPQLPFLTLLKREVLRFISVSGQTIITPIITASLYLLVFGVSLGQRVSVLEGFSYAQFVIPGLVLMGVAQNAFANSSSSLFMARYLGFLVDFLVTPLSPSQFIMAYTVAAILRGITVGVVILVVSVFFADIQWIHPVAAISLALLVGFLFAQLGILAALYSRNFDELSMFNSFLITPLIYLGGLFYPASLLPPFWAKVSMLNPLFYMIDGFRHSALGVSDLPLWLSLAVTATLSVVAFCWAAILIGRGYRLRS